MIGKLKAQCRVKPNKTMKVEKNGRRYKSRLFVVAIYKQENIGDLLPNNNLLINEWKYIIVTVCQNSWKTLKNAQISQRNRWILKLTWAKRTSMSNACPWFTHAGKRWEGCFRGEGPSLERLVAGGDLRPFYGEELFPAVVNWLKWWWWW